jgi:hypothetical protein
VLAVPTAAPITASIALGNCVIFFGVGGSSIVFNLANGDSKIGFGNHSGDHDNHRLNSGTTQLATSAAQQCAASIKTAYLHASGASCQNLRSTAGWWNLMSRCIVLLQELCGIQ